MEIFAQNKLLKIVILLLVLLNLASVGALVWKDYFRKSRPQKNYGDFKEVSAVLKKELSLSDEQEEKIRNLRTDFFNKEKVLESAIRNGRDSLNMVMFNKSTDEELAKSIARRIADNEYNMELLRIEQSQKFKSICTPEQLEKFERLVKEIRDYFKPDNPAKDKPQGKENKKEE